MSAQDLIKINFEDFTSQVDTLFGDYIKGLRAQGHQSAIDVAAMEFLRRVILTNPVDTGRSRAGWSAAAEAYGMPVPPAEKPEEAFDPSKGWKAGTIEKKETTGYYEVTITNPVDYIEDLERGSSQQAPAGMVRLAILDMLGRVPTEIEQMYLDYWDAPERRNLALRAMRAVA